MKPFSLLVGLTLFSAVSAQEPEGVTRAIGFVRVDCPEGADTWVGTPFDHRKREVLVEMRSRPRVVESRGIAVFYPREKLPGGRDEYVGTHFVRIAGPHRWAGRVYRLFSNKRTSVVVEFEDHFPHSDFSRGDRIEIVPYPTLDDLFPPGDQTTFQVSDGLLPGDRKTELLVFETEHPEANTATPPSCFFLTGDGWRQVTGEGIRPAGGFRLTPWTAMVIRHPAGQGDTEFLATGLLPVSKRWLPVRGNWGERHEIPVPVPNLVPTRLGDLNLDGENVFGESGSTDPADRASELLLFEGTGHNKGPSAVYFRVEGQWRLDDPGNSFPVSDDVRLQPGTSISIRKSGRTWFRQWDYTPIHLREGGDE